jgi:GntR family transcriptional regulator
MFIAVNPASGEPLYRQVMRQLRERIVSGQLARGERLPSVRELSAEAGLNPLTVAKAYQFLEREGFVQTRRGHGTFVAESAPSLSAAARREQLEPALRQLVAEALHLGLTEEQLQKLVSATFQTLQPHDDDE